MAFSYVWSRIHFLSCPFFARMLFLLQYFSAFVNLWFPHSPLTRFPTSLILSSLCWYFDFTVFSGTCLLFKQSISFLLIQRFYCLLTSEIISISSVFSSSPPSLSCTLFCCSTHFMTVTKSNFCTLSTSLICFPHSFCFFQNALCHLLQDH